MRQLTLAAVLALAAGTAAFAQAPAPSPNPNARFGAALMGLNSLNTASMVFSGAGTAAVPHASGRAGAPAPVTTFAVAINYSLQAVRVDVTQAGKPKRFSQFLSVDTAWEVRDGRKPTLAPSSVADLQRFIWMTPHGVMRAAQDPESKRVMANETSPDGKPMVSMAFTAGGAKYKAWLNDAAQIERVQTLPGDATLGDTIVEFLFSDYKDSDTSKRPTGPVPGGNAAIYGGIPFPTHIVQKRGGQVVLDVSLTEVHPNAGLYVEVPASIEQALAKSRAH